MDGGGESSDNNNHHHHHHRSLQLDCITFEGRDYVSYLLVLCYRNPPNTQLVKLMFVDHVSNSKVLPQRYEIPSGI